MKRVIRVDSGVFKWHPIGYGRLKAEWMLHTYKHYHRGQIWPPSRKATRIETQLLDALSHL